MLFPPVMLLPPRPSLGLQNACPPRWPHMPSLRMKNSGGMATRPTGPAPLEQPVQTASGGPREQLWEAGSSVSQAALLISIGECQMVVSGLSQSSGLGHRGRRGSDSRHCDHLTEPLCFPVPDPQLSGLVGLGPQGRSIFAWGWSSYWPGRRDPLSRKTSCCFSRDKLSQCYLPRRVFVFRSTQAGKVCKEPDRPQGTCHRERLGRAKGTGLGEHPHLSLLGGASPQPVRVAMQRTLLIWQFNQAKGHPRVNLLTACWAAGEGVFRGRPYTPP